MAPVQASVRRHRNDAQRAGEEVVRNPAFPWLARSGLVARGVVYGVIGVIAIEVAAGAGGRPTNQQGALEVIARQPLGSVLLVLLAAGLAGYSAWRLTRAATGHGREEADSGFDRVAAVASGLTYLALCAVAVEILVSAGGGTGSTSKEAAGVLGWPAGPELVAITGAVLIGVGIYQGYKALARSFMDTSRTDEIGPRAKRAFVVAGVSGHLARAVVFVLVGYGLIRAAVDHDPHSAVGLDGALRDLARAGYGQLLLGIVAAGFVTFALYSIADARLRKV